MVGLQDHPQLVFDRLLGLLQPISVPGQRLDLGQQRRGHRKRAPVAVLMAQRVGEHERIEPVVLDRGVKPRTDVVRVFPNPAAFPRLAGSVLVETHDEWQLSEGRYPSEGSMALLDTTTKPTEDVAPTQRLTA